MAVYKRNERWHYEFVVRRVRYRGSIPEARTKRMAEQAELQIRADVFEGKYGSGVKAPFLTDFIKETYLPWAKLNKRSWSHDVWRANCLIEFFGKKRLNEISPILIEKFKRVRREGMTAHGKKRSPASVNRELELLSRIFSLAIENGLPIENPCRKVRRFREDNERNRYLSYDEEARLLAALTGPREHLRPIVIMALQTGMRKGELFQLRWDAIDFQRGFIHVINRHDRGTTTKSGKSRSIPMSSVAREELLKLKESEENNVFVFVNPKTNKPYTDIKNSFTFACREAKLEDLHFHDLRHTAATRLGDAGVDARRIMAILGHASIQTSARYTHATEDGLRRAIEVLSQGSDWSPHKIPAKAEQRPSLVAVNC